MCLGQDERNPLCDDCFGKLKEAGEKRIEFKDEDMCDECRDLPNHLCFCCNISQRDFKEDLGIVDGICKSCRET